MYVYVYIIHIHTHTRYGTLRPEELRHGLEAGRAAEGQPVISFIHNIYIYTYTL